MKTLILFLFLIISVYPQGENILLLMGSDNVAENVYAIDLNGTDEYMQKVTPSNMDLSGVTWTMIAWVKTPDPIDGAGMRSLFSTDANPTRGWLWNLAPDEKWSFIYDNGVGVGVGDTPAETRAGTWTLIITTCFDVAGGVSDYVSYVDGDKKSEVLNEGNTTSGASKLTIGMDGYPQGFYWTSQLGQMQIVSGYTLTQTEITDLYNAGGVLNASYGGGTVVAWYKWEGTTNAEMLKDWSASGNDLTGTNVTTADQVLIGTTYK